MSECLSDMRLFFTTDLSMNFRPEQPNISKLTFFAEALTTQTLPGSVDLISHLLQALSSVVQALSAAQVDVNYTEQLLMSAIDSAASQVKVTNLARVSVA
jgi:hypothetical protein